jgi:hypothetical protein
MGSNKPLSKKPPKAKASQPKADKPVAKGSLLAVMINGVFLEDGPARQLWTEFSAYMDIHRNDFDGFAKSRGYTSIKPEHREGRAVLIIECAVH